MEYFHTGDVETGAFGLKENSESSLSALTTFLSWTLWVSGKGDPVEDTDLRQCRSGLAIVKFQRNILLALKLKTKIVNKTESTLCNHCFTIITGDW